MCKQDDKKENTKIQKKIRKDIREQSNYYACCITYEN
jgi:hypothetical protein